ncbi:hypothetical protein DPV78_012345 [Talaromyces pinophilus]|nr:hypothetical protein DPV78_012345 [Talaromyces pinophilus]
MPSGSCLCGKFKYEFTREPQGKASCYCLSCQKISGGTNTVNLMIPEANFHITTSSKEYSITHENGMKLNIHFCDNYGGIIYKTADCEEFRGLIVLLARTLDDLVELRMAKPQQELYTKYWVPWLSKLDGVVQKEEF